MTSRRTAISCRRCGAPGRWYLGGRLCPRHAPGGPDGEVMRAFPDYTGRIPHVNGTIGGNKAGPGAANSEAQPPDRSTGKEAAPMIAATPHTNPTGPA